MKTKEELKTLKELSECEGNDILGLENEVVRIEELRQEAIKWVKEMDKTMDEGLSIPSGKTIFKSFFNLTEEDLK